jgi:hypothetical protein
VRAVELWWNLQVRSAKPDPFGADVMHMGENGRARRLGRGECERWVDAWSRIAAPRPMLRSREGATIGS